MQALPPPQAEFRQQGCTAPVFGKLHSLVLPLHIDGSCPKKEVVWTRSHVSLIAKSAAAFALLDRRKNGAHLAWRWNSPAREIFAGIVANEKENRAVGGRLAPTGFLYTEEQEKGLQRSLSFYNTVLQRWRKLWKGKRHKKINNGCTLGLLSSNNLSCIFIAEWSDDLVVKAGAVGTQCFHPGMRETGGSVSEGEVKRTCKSVSVTASCSVSMVT